VVAVVLLGARRVLTHLRAALSPSEPCLVRSLFSGCHPGCMHVLHAIKD
jgi:hypothetical protein